MSLLSNLLFKTTQSQELTRKGLHTIEKNGQRKKKNSCEKKNKKSGFLVVDDDDDENCLAFLNRRIRESKNTTGN